MPDQIRPAPILRAAIQEPSRRSWPEKDTPVSRRGEYGFREKTNYIKGTTDGFAWSAQVFDEGSGYGINGGRVSRLIITKKGEYPAGLTNAIYHYERGLDFDQAPPGLVQKIISRWPG